MSTLVWRYAPPLFPALVSCHDTPSPPLSKSAAAMLPGIDGPDPDGADAATAIERRLPTMPLRAASTTKRMRAAPAGSVTAAVTFCHDCQPPVFGIVSGPVTSEPFTSR